MDMELPLVVLLAVDRSSGSHQGLAGHLTPVDTLAILVGAVAPEDVHLDTFEVQQGDQAVHSGLVHPDIVPSRNRPRSSSGVDGRYSGSLAAMKVNAAAMRNHARSEEGRKQLRYAGVSLVFVPLGQVLIQLFGAFVFDHPGGDVNWTAASIASAAVLTVPNFFANKYLVWKNTSKDNLRTQVIVFWVAAMLGVSLATLLTYLVDSMIAGHGLWEKVAVFCAQLTGFGIVWLARYFILDKWLFKVTHHGEAPDEEDLEMMHGDLPV